MQYIKDKSGNTHTIELYGYDKEQATICIDNFKIATLKMYYRPEKTIDDHLGNTPCGYYVNAPITDKERKRVYLKFR